MLYICIPAYDEAPTVGVLLWRIRKMFQEFSREYEILAFNDGSSDATAETLAAYQRVLPLTILGGEKRVGYAAALDALCRAAVSRTKYARRDALITMQADFTDQPEHIPELVKRFEGGADIVVAEHPGTASAPTPVRRLRRIAPWVLRPFMQVAGVSDPFGSFRLFRISVVRELIKAHADRPVARGEGWTANVDLLLRAAPIARRIETVTLDPRYDLRPRPSRVRPLNDALNLYRFAWSNRGRRTTTVAT